MRHVTFHDWAMASDIYTFSESFSPDFAKQDRIQHLLSLDSNEANSALALASGLVIQYLAIVDGSLRYFTKVCPASNSAGDSIFLAGIGDDLNVLSPVSIPQDIFHGHFLALIPKCDAEVLNLPTSTSDPSQLAGPPAPGATEDTPPDPARLGFGEVTDDNLAPVIALLPTFLPLPPGYSCRDGISISTDLLPSERTFIPVRIFQAAVRWAFKHNDSKSIHAHNRTFRHSDIDTIPFNARALQVDIDVLPHISTLAMNDPHFTNVVSLLKEAATAARYRAAASATVPDSGTSTTDTNTTAHHAALAAAVATAVASATKGSTSEVTTSSERAQAKLSSDALDRLRIAFASEGAPITDADSGDTSVSAKYPTISDAITEVLKAPKTAAAVNIMQEQWDHHSMLAAASDNRLDFNANFPSSSIDASMVTYIRNHNWATENPSASGTSHKNKLGVMHFTTPAIASVHYQQRILDDNTVHCQEMVGEDKSKVAKRTTDLYCAGKLDSPEDLQRLISNIWLLGSFIVKDWKSNPPFLWRAIARVDKVLSTAQGRLWLHSHTGPSASHLYHMIGMEFHGIVAQFFKMSGSLAYRKAASADAPIALQGYFDILLQADAMATRIQSLIPNTELGDHYSRRPFSLALFGPQSIPNSSPEPPLLSPIPRKTRHGGGGPPEPKTVTPPLIKRSFLPLLLLTNKTILPLEPWDSSSSPAPEPPLSLRELSLTQERKLQRSSVQIRSIKDTFVAGEKIVNFFTRKNSAISLQTSVLDSILGFYPLQKSQWLGKRTVSDILFPLHFDRLIFQNSTH
jgi:hypothetical protein